MEKLSNIETADLRGRSRATANSIITALTPVRLPEKIIFKNRFVIFPVSNR